mgnify:CR=1 FL=1
MKKKIIIILLIAFFGILCYEAYFFTTNDSNSSLIISGQNRASSGKAILYINDKKIDTINLDSHYAYNDDINLSFGTNKVLIKGINNKISYETNFMFFGLYNWNMIDYTEDGFIKYKYYMQPTID